MYDIIVVGGGHAGCEAAHIAAVMGMKTLLITLRVGNIADMPCNPSIGGTSKGVIVREVDALGGLMGKITDISQFQMKMLNSSKGPAVRCLRAQADKVLYPQNMLKALHNTQNLDIKEGKVEDLLTNNHTVTGVILDNKTEIKGKAVILTTGTYTKSNILIGSKNIPGGPHGEDRSNHLSDNLRKHGLKIIRLKTGTPQRIDASSIDFTKLHEEKGDEKAYTFSFDNKPMYNPQDQRSCYLVYTNELTHQIIKDNLKKSAMYGGYATGVGPRYCPSIEDKIVRFKDKERHQLFLEPESNFYNDWYIQGFSTSMPEDVQELMVHSLPGLERAVINKYAYAIEYDAIDPLQIKPSEESKILENLFTAGQINGTSGYEEAAGQGIIAGINAARKIQNKPPFILKRDEAYIGVLIDDLVTKGTIEPYRMLTSRAEFRLILRHDNADIRLRKYGYLLGTISKKQYKSLEEKISNINKLTEYLKTTKIIINDRVKDVLSHQQIKTSLKADSALNILKRPEITMEILSKIIPIDYDDEIKEQVEISTKYQGYIKKAYDQAAKLRKLETKIIPDDIDYDKVKNLATEARQKLNQVRPVSIAQASRISGVNPSDISVLSVYLKKEYNHE